MHRCLRRSILQRCVRSDVPTAESIHTFCGVLSYAHVHRMNLAEVYGFRSVRLSRKHGTELPAGTRIGSRPIPVVCCSRVFVRARILSLVCRDAGREKSYSKRELASSYVYGIPGGRNCETRPCTEHMGTWAFGYMKIHERTFRRRCIGKWSVYLLAPRRCDAVLRLRKIGDFSCRSLGTSTSPLPLSYCKSMLRTSRTRAATTFSGVSRLYS